MRKYETKSPHTIICVRINKNVEAETPQTSALGESQFDRSSLSAGEFEKEGGTGNGEDE